MLAVLLVRLAEAEHATSLRAETREVAVALQRFGSSSGAERARCLSIALVERFAVDPSARGLVARAVARAADVLYHRWLLRAQLDVRGAFAGEQLGLLALAERDALVLAWAALSYVPPPPPEAPALDAVPSLETEVGSSPGVWETDHAATVAAGAAPGEARS